MIPLKFMYLSCKTNEFLIPFPTVPSMKGKQTKEIGERASHHPLQQHGGYDDDGDFRTTCNQCITATPCLHLLRRGEGEPRTFMLHIMHSGENNQLQLAFSVKRE